MSSGRIPYAHFWHIDVPRGSARFVFPIVLTLPDRREGLTVFRESTEAETGQISAVRQLWNKNVRLSLRENSFQEGPGA